MTTETLPPTNEDDDYHGDICYTEDQLAIRALVDTLDKILHLEVKNND